MTVSSLTSTVPESSDEHAAMLMSSAVARMEEANVRRIVRPFEVGLDWAAAARAILGFLLADVFVERTAHTDSKRCLKEEQG